MRTTMFFLALILAGCAPASFMPTPAPTITPTPSPAITGAVSFLKSQYDPAVGLLRESPIVAPDRHWLATDNRLAVFALTAVGESEFAQTLDAAIARHGGELHGVIEALTGAPIEWPPRTHTQTEVTPGVWNEERTSGEPMLDWAEYADLAFYGALEAANRGDADEASRRYDAAMLMFDGVGFDDFATDTHYATYKLALALIAGNRLDKPARPDLVDLMLAKQNETGGFVTLYNRQGAPEGDANTETTSYALLALIGLR